MFDDIIAGLIIIGIVIGLLLAGLGAFLWWVFSHLTIGWV